MIALLEAYRAGLLRREHLIPNVIAGMIVGVVALPLAMAFAIASGATPEQGLYTAIVAGLAVSIFGGSRVQIAGPTGAFIVILAGITAEHGISGLQIATLMAGVILLVLGWARLGGIIKYIPDPVVIGFTAGIGVIIFVGQWQYFFGIDPAQGEHFHEKFWHLLLALPGLHLPTTALALLSLALVLLTPRVAKRVPGPLVAMVVATFLQATFQFEGVATIGSAFGGIPQSLPSFQLPELTFNRILDLIGPAFAIAMLGAIESLLSAVVADGMAGTRHNSNQELIGQGLANIAAPLFGGFAATGAIARTATNIRNGGNSPLAGIVHSVTLIAIVLALAPLAENVPLSALAAILFVVAYNMSQVRHFVSMARRAPRADVIILLVTFALTVFADLVIAVNVGVVLAALLFMRRMAQTVQVAPLEPEHLNGATNGEGLPRTVLTYSVDGPFFFGAAETFENALAAINTDARVVILRLGRVPFIDATGLQTLQEVIEKFHQRGTTVLVCEANSRVASKLGRAGITALLAPHGLLPDLSTATDAARMVLADRKLPPSASDADTAAHR